MYKDIHQHGSYIILISGPCKECEEYISGLWKQLFELSVDEKMWLSWNPRAKFIVSVIPNCKHLDNNYISSAILNRLWNYQVGNAIVLLLKSNEQHKACTWNCTLGILMRIQTDAIQLKALYR